MLEEFHIKSTLIDAIKQLYASNKIFIKIEHLTTEKEEEINIDKKLSLPFAASKGI